MHPDAEVNMKHVKKGLVFLKENCDEEKAFQNERVGDRTNSSVAFHPPEILTTLMSMDLIGDQLDEQTKMRVLKFLRPKNDGPLIAPKNLYLEDNKLLPDEVDVTAIFMHVYLKRGMVEKNEAFLELARRIITNTNKEGIIQIYFPPRGEREGQVDPTVCCNAMRLIYSLGMREKAMATEDYLFSVLEAKGYNEPSFDYMSPDIFLMYLARAIVCDPDAKERFYKPIKEAMKDRLRQFPKHPIDVSARILALEVLDLVEPVHDDDILDDDTFDDYDFSGKAELERREIAVQHNDDGSFREDCLFKKNRKHMFFGGKAISTIFSVAALKIFGEVEMPKPKY